jgi:hypothetical protein
VLSAAGQAAIAVLVGGELGVFVAFCVEVEDTTGA